VYNVKLDCQPFQLRPYSFLLINVSRNHKGIYYLTPYFVFLLITPHLGNTIIYSKYHRVTLYRKGRSSHFRVWVMLIIEDPTKTAKSSRAITTLFLHYNLCPSAMFDCLSCSFTSISFPITRCSFTVSCV
jgi:hypothetical protein